MVKVRSLAQEIIHAACAAEEKKKKNRNSGKSVRNFQLLKIFCLHCSNESFLLTCISLHLALKKEYLAFVKFQVLQVCII